MDPTDSKSYVTKEEYESKKVQFAGVGETTPTSEVEENLNLCPNVKEIELKRQEKPIKL